MKEVWRYELALGTNLISMPAGARVLSVQAKDNVGCMWALVDRTAAPEDRTFCVYPTGGMVPDALIYVGTFQLVGAKDFIFVGHVFEFKV